MKSLFNDTRANIFYLFGFLSLLLLWPCPENFRPIGVILVLVYLLLGIASWVDHKNRTHRVKKS